MTRPGIEPRFPGPLVNTITTRGTLTSVRMDLGVMAIKRFSTFPKALELEPHYQMQFSDISRTLIVREEVKHVFKDAAGVFYSTN